MLLAVTCLALAEVQFVWRFLLLWCSESVSPSPMFCMFGCGVAVFCISLIPPPWGTYRGSSKFVAFVEIGCASWKTGCWPAKLLTKKRSFTRRTTSSFHKTIANLITSNAKLMCKMQDQRKCKQHQCKTNKQHCKAIQHQRKPDQNQSKTVAFHPNNLQKINRAHRKMVQHHCNADASPIKPLQDRWHRSKLMQHYSTPLEQNQFKNNENHPTPMPSQSKRMKTHALKAWLCA